MAMDLNDTKTRQLCGVVPIRATNIVFMLAAQVLREDYKQYSSAIQFRGEVTYGMINLIHLTLGVTIHFSVNVNVQNQLQELVILSS